MADLGTSFSAVVKRFNEAQSKLVLQTSDLPLGTLAGMVEAGNIDLQPSFQRRERWSVDKQSALIESFLLNVPVPPVFLAEEADGTYSAIDGKQRLRAIADFMTDRLVLSNLESFTQAEGIIFSQLPPEVRNAFTLRPFLRVVTLLKQTERNLKFEVFLRLNKGGERLENQEIRNVAYRGPMNDAIYKLAETPFLLKQLKINDKKSIPYRLMKDAEMVLRFLALHHRSDKYSGFLSREMDTFIATNQAAGTEIVKQKELLFSTALSRCEDIWGDFSFKRPGRDQLLAGMYDAQMLGVAKWTDAQFAKAMNVRGETIEKTKKLFDDPVFDQAVRIGTNTPQRLDFRVNKIANLVN